MKSPDALLCGWDGEHLSPVGKTWASRADKTLVVGERYYVDVQLERSQASHNFYFAAVHDAWSNLRDDAAMQFPTAEHLRKYALVKAGFRDERSIVAATRAEALRIAAFIKPMDDFAIVTVFGAVVVVHAAKSQSARAMGKDEFERSKTAVLDIVAGLIGTDAGTLSSQSP